MSDSQQPPDPEPQTRGCLYTILCCIALLAVSALLFTYLQNRAKLAFEEKKAEWRQKEFDAVRNGQTHAWVLDPLLLPMLANDSVCVKNLESIFFSIDFTPEMAVEIAKLKNLKEISFYGGLGVEQAVAGAAKIPVESVGFDTVIVDEALIRQLATFPNLKEVQLVEELDPERRELFESHLPGVRIVTPSSATREPPAQTTPVEAE